MIGLKIKYLIILLVITAVNASGQNTSAKQRTILLTNPDKPYELDMKLYQGKMKVTGYDGRHIIMETEGKVSIHTDETDNRVTISTGFTNDSVTVKLKIPRNRVTLKLGVLNNGTIEVTDVAGEMEIGNVNGGIILTGISGSALATSVNGDILVTFKSVTPNTPMAFSSLSGKIDITYPADTHASIRLKSDNGKIHSDFRIAAGLQPTSKKEQTGTQLTSAEWRYIKINGGGAETSIRNMYGNIFIRRVK